MYPVSLKISGFKSFAETASLSFSVGVSAVVGPNGCGKSNIVEALRWVMGEGSARRLRSGSDMEEVIFAGSLERPPFSRAEVTLQLARNVDRTVDRTADKTVAKNVEILPAKTAEQPSAQQLAKDKANTKVSGQKGVGLLAQLRNEDRISISRRIETGGGSSYRINGRDALARDVHTLCADMGLGANASALVGQGQVAELVNAKPSERRLLIEEAAGVRGLYARRSDALSGLESTRATLARVEERLQEDKQRLKTLEKESTRAEHYRVLSQQIVRLRAAELVREDTALRTRLESLQAREVKLSATRDSCLTSLAAIEAQIAETQASCEDARGREVASAAHCQSLAQDIALQERAAQEREERQRGLEQRRDFALRSRSEQEQALVAAKDLWQDALAVIKTAGNSIGNSTGNTGEANTSESLRVNKKEQTAKESTRARLAEIDAELGACEQQLTTVMERLRELERQGAISSERLAVSRERKEQIERELAKLSHELQAQDKRLDKEQDKSSPRPADDIVTGDIVTGDIQTAEAIASEITRLESSNEKLQREVLPNLRAREEELLKNRESLHSEHLSQTATLQATRNEQRDKLRLASSALAAIDSSEADKIDSGNIDSGNIDSGNIDSGNIDSGNIDSGKPDSDKLDSGKTPKHFPQPSPKPLPKPLPKLLPKLLLGELKVAPDLSLALFGALGDDLFASLHRSDKRYWLALRADDRAADPDSPPQLPAKLPAGITSLAQHIDLNPTIRAALQPRLEQIGLVASASEGDKLQGTLRQGQRLVSRAGNCWRWDGLRSGAAVAVAAEQRYQSFSQSFLQWSTLHAGLATSETALRQAERDYSSACAKAASELTRTRSDYQTSLSSERSSLDRLGVLRKLLRASELRVREQEQQRARVAQLNLDLGASIAISRAASTSLEALAERPELERVRAELDQQRQALVTERAGKVAEEQRVAALLAREQAEQRARVETEQRLRSLKDKNSQVLSNIVASVRDIESQLTSLSLRPLQDSRELKALQTRHRASELARAKDKDAYERANKLLAANQERRRVLTLRSADLDKDLVRLQTQGEHLPREREQLGLRSQDELSCSLAKLSERHNLDATFLAESLEVQRAARRSATEKRSRLGDINFAAQQTLAELKSKHEESMRQHRDVAAAISRLTLSVRKLETEASSKLLRVREEVGARFSIFIARLFGGGEGRIFFSEPSDPINSGLEISLSLPGKRIKSLSAMSGGEQSLVAIALILSVFSVAGGGFCILDEVDAALDDVNVSRFCDLLDDISRTGLTRFLVITHHHYTMSRAARLYGVAMPEPGCSRIVSVALDDALAHARTAAE